MMKFLSDGEEIIVGKGENAGISISFFFPHSIQMPFDKIVEKEETGIFSFSTKRLLPC